MDAEQARRTLTEERHRLVELGAFNQEQKPEPAVQQEGAMGQHPGDYGTEVEEFMDAEAMEDLTARQVTEIDEALARIEDGSWGRCVVCGRDIDAERLEARPQAERCREHQEELERSSR
ncbi:TraR/DksA family transcriptional regulator [Actinomycetospora soli]|uniref:TraR/DksA family transcriptional regulator n=1 Tax=Actinomycetospora soli TaxID=2893887 RepID=UPI001E2BB871|nr:TraR/DksA C4-type zinc finger protein [Actinomycetospora soli]MCD2189696.1 TraR/DksA C4-type zinc finger protein [Actinomycetospora soli]